MGVSGITEASLHVLFKQNKPQLVSDTLESWSLLRHDRNIAHETDPFSSTASVSLSEGARGFWAQESSALPKGSDSMV